MDSNCSLFGSKGKLLLFVIVMIGGYLTPSLVSSEPYADCPTDGCDYHNDFPLEDRDGRINRRIKKSSVEFLNSYIDYNIVEANAYPDPETALVSDFYVTYTNGDVVAFPLDKVEPKILQPGGGHIFVKLKTTEFIKAGGLIYPATNTYNQTDTPNLSYLRTRVHWIIEGRRQVLEMAELVAPFAFAMASLGSHSDFIRHPPNFYQSKVRPPIHYKPSLRNHIIYGEAPTGSGIKGAHNKREFMSHSDMYQVVITEAHPNVRGIEKIHYKMARLDNRGNPTGEFKSRILKKTVYDPSIIPDRNIMHWGLEATIQAHDNGVPHTNGSISTWSGKASNGLRFRGHTDPSGVATFFPDF